MDLGQAIRTLRMKQGMTQGQLAEKCDMSVSGLSYLETGRSVPPKGTMEKLCNALGVPMSYMLLASIDETDIPEEKRVLYRALVEPLRNELLEKKED